LSDVGSSARTTGGPLHESVSQVTVYGGLVFTLILLTVPVAVWKPRWKFNKGHALLEE